MGKWLFLAEFVIGTALICVFLVGLGRPELAGIESSRLTDLLSVALLAWWGVYLLITIFSIVEAVRYVRRDNLAALRRSMVMVKVSSVPFFVLNFVLASLITLGTRLIGVAFVVPVTYVLMLLTSAYGIGCLVVLRRRGIVKGWVVGVFVAAQLVFVLDVVSAIALAIVSLRAKVSPGHLFAHGEQAEEKPTARH